MLFHFLCRPEVYHLERAPRTGALIVAANHVSYFDPVLVGAAMPRPLYYMARDSLFRPPLGWVIRQVNAFPVRRGAADIGSVRRALAVLERGDALLVFPEGTRSADGQLQAAQPGIGLLARRTGAEILPVFVEGMERVLGRGRWLPRRAQVRIYIGDPFLPEPNAEPAETAARVMNCLAALRASRAEIQLDCPQPLR
jgi:1-acyl-sn-glycerol-3-phosphate acyltransferase